MSFQSDMSWRIKGPSEYVARASRLTILLIANAFCMALLKCPLQNVKFVDIPVGLKLYCGYIYARPSIFNRIWGLKQL